MVDLLNPAMRRSVTSKSGRWSVTYRLETALPKATRSDRGVAGAGIGRVFLP